MLLLVEKTSNNYKQQHTFHTPHRMGCACSTDLAPIAGSTYAAAGIAACALCSVVPCTCFGGGGELYNERGSNKTFTAAELRLLDGMNRVSSCGSAASEPGALSRSAGIGYRVFKARAFHGVTADAGQCEQEPPVRMKQAARVVVIEWMDDVAAANEVVNEVANEVATEAAARRHSVATTVSDASGPAHQSTATAAHRVFTRDGGAAAAAAVAGALSHPAEAAHDADDDADDDDDDDHVVEVRLEGSSSACDGFQAPAAQTKAMSLSLSMGVNHPDRRPIA
jgi:hypothetical protein